MIVDLSFSSDGGQTFGSVVRIAPHDGVHPPIPAQVSFGKIIGFRSLDQDHTSEQLYRHLWREIDRRGNSELSKPTRLTTLVLIARSFARETFEHASLALATLRLGSAS